MIGLQAPVIKVKLKDIQRLLKRRFLLKQIVSTRMYKSRQEHFTCPIALTCSFGCRTFSGNFEM